MPKLLPVTGWTKWTIAAVSLAGLAGGIFALRSTPPLPSEHLAPAIVAVEPKSSDQPAQKSAPRLEAEGVVAPAALAPRFDHVRVGSTGDALIAGRAPPSSTVAILIDNEPVAQSTSSATGEFALIFDVPAHSEARLLELEVRLPGGEILRSEDTLMLAPRSVPAERPATADDTAIEDQILSAALDEAEQSRIASEPGMPLPAVTQAQTTLTPDMAEVTSPVAVLLSPDSAPRVLEPAATARRDLLSANVSIDTVTYDDIGDIALGGRSREAGSDIRIYIDNQLVSSAQAQTDGTWQAQLAGIERGVYQLRVDEVDATAAVTSRAEIPFERVTPEIARTAAGPQALIVQPGNTLWGMSEQQLGAGWRYLRIFDANRDQIRNPDLIYPGQVFIIPALAD